MSVNHTPTPWRADRGNCGEMIGLRSIENIVVAMLGRASALKPEDVEFIVLACNSHDALLAAVENFSSHPDTCGQWIHGSLGSVRSEERRCTCGLDAAIKTAKGEA